MPPDRRTVLEVTGGTVTAATLGILGCPTVAAQDAGAEEEDGDEADEPDDVVEADLDEDDLPDYSRWLVFEDDALEFTAIDWEAVGEDVRAELEAADMQADPDVPPEYEADPMVVLPSEGLYSSYLLVTLSLGQYGLGRLLEPDAFETTVEDLVVSNEVTVAAGDVDTDEIDAQLTADPGNGFATQFEQIDEIDDADVYTPVEGDGEGAPDRVAIAVDDDALVIADREGDDPVATLETILDAAAGEGDRAADEDDVAWLLEAAGDGDAVVGGYGEPTTGANGLVDERFEALADAEGLVASITPEGDAAATAALAAIIPEPDEDALSNSLGVSADDRSISPGDGSVTASARWEQLEEL